MMLDGLLDTDLEERSRIKTGQHSHRHNYRCRMTESLVKIVGNSSHHGSAATGVQGHHRYAELRRFAGRTDDRVGNIVKLQIEENASAQIDYFADDGGAGGHEQLAA